MKGFKVGDSVYIDRGDYLPRIFGTVVSTDGMLVIKDENNDSITYAPNVSKVFKVLL